MTCPLRIGNQTSVSADLMAPFEYALNHGFTAFEWFPDGWDPENIDGATREFIRGKAVEHGITLSVHVPWHANPLKVSPDLFRDNISFAGDLGAGLLNIHFFGEEGIEPYLKAISPIIRLTAEAGIRLSIENTIQTGPEDFNGLFAALGAMEGTDHVGMCLDLGHANLCDATRNDYLRFVDLLSPRVPIIHLHLHENYGDGDRHLPLFTGPSASDPSGIRGLMKRLMKRGFSGSAILEQWPDPPSLLETARERLCLMTEEITAEDQMEEPGDFLETLAEADRRNGSWREKLLWVRDALSEGHDQERLIAIAIYLRFIGTGQVRCREDGRHFRPGHHARAAEDISEILSRITDPSLTLIIRKIYPWLPSYGEAFKRAEPLTRIRDIAHRNDIPQELKSEIKHNLQNKLHRCAGPEDLAASEAILKRITAPEARYSPAFVEEFRLFHEELREFFNAGGLEERLEGLIHKGIVDEEGAGLIRSFLSAKKKKEATVAGDRTHALTAITRKYLLQVLRKLRGAEAQQVRLADIGLEDYAFVLVSGDMGHFQQVQFREWEPLVELLILVVENLRLSGMEPEECRAVNAHLTALSRVLCPRDRDFLLRIKGELERCLRLSQGYTDRILSLFPERVERLGRMLGVPESAIRFYAEGDIRGNLAFQLSGIASLLLKEIRLRAGLSPWDPIVTGKTGGLVAAAPSLQDLPSGAGIIAVLEKVEGDEEIPEGVRGIILGHDLPHLSHLGVRARQKGVPLAVCEEEKELLRIRGYAGQEVILSVSPEGVQVEIGSGEAAEERREAIACIPEVSISFKKGLLPLAEVTPQNGGSKAFSAKNLDGLARKEGSGFQTPGGIVVPFGVMEESLRSVPDMEREYGELARSVNSLPPQEFDMTAERLRDLVRRLPVPEEIVREVAELFGGARIMVRSSSSCEDLKEMSGAGLYDSIANVHPSQAGKAIAEVWASLWTRRAAISRRQSGFPHERAHMAVLIQEMVVPDYSFIIHTVNPVNHRQNEVYMELAVGLGEVLASGAVRGLPYRMVCDTGRRELRLLSYASFSTAIHPGGTGLITKTVDYSQVGLTTDAGKRESLAFRLAATARLIEASLGYPQDIEGVVRGEDIFIVQTRPQQGLKKNG